MPLLVRHRYLAVIPHILITVDHISDVAIYVNARVLICCRAHRVSLIVLLALDGAVHRLKDRIVRGREDVCVKRI